MNDEMRPVVGIDGYCVTTDGRVFSEKRKIYLKTQYAPEPNRSQIRPYVVMRCNGKRVKKLISRIVAEAFIPNPHNYNNVCHINDCSTDNRVENLKWACAKINAADRKRNALRDIDAAELDELRMKVKMLTLLLSDLTK